MPLDPLPQGSQKVEFRHAVMQVLPHAKSSSSGLPAWSDGLG